MGGLETVEIRSWQETDSVEELTHLLHRAYRPLAEMGFRYVASYQAPEVTRDRMAGAWCWVATTRTPAGRDELIATLCLYPPDPTHRCRWYAQEGVWHFGQFAVHPDHQEAGIGTRLLELAEETARGCGAWEIALDTAEGASHLIDYYAARGYRQVGYVQWGVTNYRSVVMSKNLAEGPGQPSI